MRCTCLGKTLPYLAQTPPFPSRIRLSIQYTLFVTGHLRDTLHTSTCFHLFPPVSTDAARRDRPRRDGNLPAIYGNLTAICRILPYSAKSTESCQVLPGPRLDSYSALCICRPSNQVHDIYPFSPFPYLLSLRNVLTLSHSLCT